MSAVRVKVKKCEANLSPEWRKFSVDPQITNIEVLYSILAKAFDLRTDFGISYRAVDPSGNETYLVVLSDWDLDAAFLRAHNISVATKSEPCLNLKIDVKPFSETPDYWDGTASIIPREIVTIQHTLGAGQKYVQSKLPGLIMNHMEKTFSMVQRAFNLVEDPLITQTQRNPLSDAEFRSYCDSVGQIIQPGELRRVIYAAGIDPSLRRVVWKHILNVYPDGMTGRDRMNYIKKKSGEYYKLRETWRAAVQRGNMDELTKYVTGMVRKDVLRTDRLHHFYAGSDDNQNIGFLFNILTTYALNHPKVSYCQGMSDIASPLLVTMGDEAQAYICFCAIMSRLNSNFMLDGIAMTQKFTHLSEALQYYDPDFYAYLKMHQADDLLFCYRWLLLEMKREFAFEDALRMLEVLWSSLPAMPPKVELMLFEKEYTPDLQENVQQESKNPNVILRENPYTKVCALRRQSSAFSLTSTTTTNPININSNNRLKTTRRINLSLDENIGRNFSSYQGSSSRIIDRNHKSLDEVKVMLVKQKKINKSMDDDTNCTTDNLESPPTDLDTIDSIEELNDLEDNVFDSPKNIKLVKSSPIKRINHDSNIAMVQKNPFLSDSSSNSPSPTNQPPLLVEMTTQQNKNASPLHKSKGLFSTSTTNMIARQLSTQRRNIGSSGGQHFKDLKEKITAGKKGILSTLEKNDTESNNNESTKPKLVKNFNEFLNFTSLNKNRTADSTVNLKTSDNTTDNIAEKPLIKLTKSSFDESKCSSIDHQEDKDEAIVINTKVDENDSSPEDSQEYFPMTTSMTRELRLELENLDRQVFGTNFQNHQRFYTLGSGCIEMDNQQENGDSISTVISSQQADISYKKLDFNGSCDIQSVDDIAYLEESTNTEIIRRKKDKINNPNAFTENRISTASLNADVFVWENPLHQCESPLSAGSETLSKNLNKNSSTPDEQIDIEYDDGGEIIIETMQGKKSVTPIRLIRKSGDKSSNNNSNRNSMVLNESDYSDEQDSLPSSIAFKFHPNNPFYEANVDIAHTKQPIIELKTETTLLSTSASSYEEGTEASNIVNKEYVEIMNNSKDCCSLPPPDEFGGGNPFLMFLCITILMQHRDYVMKAGMDYNEMAMHFDKMVRKHNVVRVLNQARQMYSEYMKSYSNYYNNTGDNSLGSKNDFTAGIAYNT